MNFFKHQDEARKKSRQLLVLFLLGICSLILVTSLFVSTFLFFLHSYSSTPQIIITQNSEWTSLLYELIFTEHTAWIAVGVCSVAAIGSWLKHLELKKGGTYIAESLGAKPLDTPYSKEEKVLKNVVEEMSIASGCPVPRIYLLEDQAINAFAAGNSPTNAVIGVTRGTLEKLNRNELQGVIAHEFSHIYHGDMRLNMRLLALLHGLVAIGLIGELLTRGGGRRSFYGRRRKGNQLALLGIGLVVIGFCGTLFGRAIKAAVSRQREFLADASAVQYTRSPDGIGGALKAIIRNTRGSIISSSNASEYSHFYFSEGVRGYFSRYLSTHPPLNERIQRVLGKSHAPASPGTDHLTSSSHTIESSQAQLSALQPDLGLGTTTTEFGLETTKNTRNTIGSVNNIRTEIKPLLQQAREPYLARVIVFALLIHEDATYQERQIRYLESELHRQAYKEFKQLLSNVSTLSKEKRFALAQVCCAALGQLSAKQRSAFLTHANWLITADRKVSIDEWALLQLVKTAFYESAHSETLQLQKERESIGKILRFLTELNPKELRRSAFYHALDDLEIRKQDVIDYPEFPSLKQIDAALNRLKKLRPLEKPRLIKALARSANYDNHLSFEEQITLKAISASLSCPISL